MVLTRHPYRLWTQAAAVVLIATAAAKLAGILFQSPLLQGVEPMTGLPLSSVAALIAVGESILASVLLGSSTAGTAAALTFVFAAGALGYRLLILSPQAPCPCLGGISHWLPWLAVYERNVLLLILVWLLLTAGGVLLHRRQSATSVRDT